MRGSPKLACLETEAMRGVQRGGPVGTEQADAHFSHDTASHRAQLLAMMCDLSSK